MKQFNPIRIFAIVSILLSISVLKAEAQLDSCNVFLKGNYIEVGVNINGAYGSSANAPSGYHPKGAAGVGNPCYPGFCPTSGLGFVADPDKDGWTVGTPPYFGDYFLPGTPQEGWSIEIDSVQQNAWNGNGFCGATSGYPYTSGALTGKNISYSNVGLQVSGVWQGMFDSVQITQLTTLDTNRVYFTVYITLKNLSDATKKGVYYLRTLDPDNDEPEPSGSFTTSNKILYQLPNQKNRTLVNANGTGYPRAFLGLGTLDCRAKCFIVREGLFPSDGQAGHSKLDSMYNGNGGLGDTSEYIYNTTSPYVNDCGIGLVFKLGDIPAGDSVNFAYAYVLRAADLDSAFLSTQPKWIGNSDTVAHASGDTSSVCKNHIAEVSIVNGAYLNWFWFPAIGLDTNQGTTVHVRVDSTPRTYMAIGSSPSCVADTLIITVNPNLSPAPKVVDPVVYCAGGTSAPLVATGQNLRWYRTNNPSDTGTTAVPTPSTDSVGTFLYYVSETVRGCTSDRSVIHVVINPPLPALNVSNNGPLCLGDTLLLHSDSSVGASYSWTGPDGFTSSDRNPSIPGVVEEDTGKYTLIASVGGCPSKASSTSLYIDEVVAEIGVSHDSICLNNPINVSFNGIAPDTGVTTYTWGFPHSKILTGSGAGPYIIKYDTLGDYPVTLHVSNWRCNSYATINVHVDYAPPIAFSVRNNICVNDSTAINVANYNLQNAQNIKWNFGGATSVSGLSSGSYIVSWSTAGKKVVSVDISYPQCFASKTDTLLIHALPDASIASISRNNICMGDTIIFTAATKGSGYSYQWKPAPYFPEYVATSNTATGRIANTGNIYLTVTDSIGCVATDSININTQACCGVFLPSAFTPNGDGKNDVFKPITKGNHTLKVFRIVNRWGQTVFESNDEKLGWDGNFNGIPQDLGTYFWYLNYTCDGKTIEEKGEVILIR